MWLDAGELGEVVRYTSSRIEGGKDPAFDDGGSRVRPEIEAYIASMDRDRAARIDRLEDMVVEQASDPRYRTSVYVAPEVSRSYHARHGGAPPWSATKVSFTAVAVLAVIILALSSTVRCGRGSPPPPERASPPAHSAAPRAR